VKEVLEKLEKEAHRLASVMYQGAGGTPGAGPNAGPANGAPPEGAAEGDEKKKKEGGVIDAEFEETQ
jgi:molecular chaperone DnaK